MGFGLSVGQNFLINLNELPVSTDIFLHLHKHVFAHMKTIDTNISPLGSDTDKNSFQLSFAC